MLKMSAEYSNSNNCHELRLWNACQPRAVASLRWA